MGRSRWSFDIGQVAGVRIRVHASFLLLFVLVLLSGVRTVNAALAEAGWILALFACVVVHELAHSVTAIHRGIKVQDIVLFPLGGATEMDRVPDDPRTELLIAGAGPAASLALAGLLLAVGALTGQAWWPPSLLGGSVLVRLMWVNALLAGFNLLPVLPMDGGRILRALLEPRLGRTASTVTAARIGMAGGAVLVAVGFVYNLWLVFIGAFILLGARMEGTNAEIHQRLSTLLVRDAMLPLPATAEAGTRLDWHWLHQVVERQGVLPVTQDGVYVGVIGPAQSDRVAPDQPAGLLMDRQAPVVGPDEPLDRALDVVQQTSQPGAVVVGAGGHVVGIVTLEGLRSALAGPAWHGR